MLSPLVRTDKKISLAGNAAWLKITLKSDDTAL